MAKVAFSKLNAKVKEEVTQIKWEVSDSEIIFFEVRTYLPIEEKINMISRIINLSIDENNFYNPIRLKIFMALELIYAYTNLSFSTKQKENIFKLYDQLVSSGLYDNIIDCIPKSEIQEVEHIIITIIDNVYKYKNSALGIIDSISKDYSNVDNSLEEISDKLADPNILSLIKEIVPLMNMQA